MNRIRDPDFEAFFELVEEDEPKTNSNGTPLYRMMVFKCRGCEKSWEVKLRDGQVTLDKGSRNPLMAHAATHAPGYHPGMRRRT